MTESLWLTKWDIMKTSKFNINESVYQIGSCTLKYICVTKSKTYCENTKNNILQVSIKDLLSNTSDVQIPVFYDVGPNESKLVQVGSNSYEWCQDKLEMH